MAAQQGGIFASKALVVQVQGLGLRVRSQYRCSWLPFPSVRTRLIHAR